MSYSGTERRALLAASRRADENKLVDRKLVEDIRALRAIVDRYARLDEKTRNTNNGLYRDARALVSKEAP